MNESRLLNNSEQCHIARDKMFKMASFDCRFHCGVGVRHEAAPAVYQFCANAAITRELVKMYYSDKVN